ncbi:hypothetical protein ACP275_07G117500 [Erythranthe tilingii]
MHDPQHTNACSTVATPPPITSMPAGTSKMKETAKGSYNGACSVFVGEDFLKNRTRNFIRELWKDLRAKIARTSIDSISSLEEGVQPVLETMKNLGNFDISCLEESLKTLFSQATAYDEARSLSSEKASKEILARQLKEAKDRLHNTQVREQKETLQVQATNDDLVSVKKERAALNVRIGDLRSSLKRQQELLGAVQTEIREINEEITAIENTSPLSDDMVEDLRASAKLLEDAKENLRDLDPFA